MYQGLLFVDSTLNERMCLCRTRSMWIKWIVRSGNASCKWLRTNVIGKKKIVIENGLVFKKVCGHYAARHMASWYRMIKDHKWKELREVERVLRHSVQYWKDRFPVEQEKLKDAFYIKALSLHPMSYYVRETLNNHYYDSSVPIQEEKCFQCGNPGPLYCPSCRVENGSYEEDREEFLKSFFLT